MRILVTGGTGIVGWDLVRVAGEHGHDVMYTYNENAVEWKDAVATRLDVRDVERTHEIVDRFDPDYVLHTAALANADECERNPKKARDVNVEGTRNVVAASRETGSKIVLFSSSFVFSGSEEEYSEDNTRDPVNEYGITKVKAEDIVTQSLPSDDSMIVRTDQPYSYPESWQTDTMVSWTLERLRRGVPFDVFADWYNNPILVRDLTNAVLELISLEEDGAYHVVGPDYISRYEWARRIASAFDERSSLIEPTSSSDAKLPAERPNANLSSEKLRSTIQTSIRGIDGGVEKLAESTFPGWTGS